MAALINGVVINSLLLYQARHELLAFNEVPPANALRAQLRARLVVLRGAQVAGVVPPPSPWAAPVLPRSCRR